MTEQIDADIVVIGAGIAGAGVAADLARDFKVVNVEMESRPGYHTTGRSAAIFIQNYGSDAIRALSRQSAPMFVEADRALFPNPLLSPRGMLNIAGPDDVTQHEAHVATGEGVVELSVAEAVAMVPILRAESVAAVSYEADARDIDVAALHQGWLKAAKQAGGRLLTDAKVVAANRVNAKWSVETTSHRIAAPIIVNAAGAWADQVAALFGVAPIGLTPLRRSMAVIAVPDEHDSRRWPLFGDVPESWYAKPDGGKLFVSPADEDLVEPHDAFVDDMVLAEGLYRFEQAVTFPVTHVERSWAGLRTFTSDRTPVAGFDATAEGFFWLAGQGGYGIQTSPALSRLAGRLIRQASLSADMEALSASLSPNRFRLPKA